MKTLMKKHKKKLDIIKFILRDKLLKLLILNFNCLKNNNNNNKST